MCSKKLIKLERKQLYIFFIIIISFSQKKLFFLLLLLKLVSLTKLLYLTNQTYKIVQ